jgi:hypothetical protein
MAILVDRYGRERTVDIGDAEGAALSVVVPRKVYDEPVPFKRTVATFFDGPHVHFAHDHYALEFGDMKYHYTHTDPPDAPLAARMAAVGGGGEALRWAPRFR